LSGNPFNQRLRFVPALLVFLSAFLLPTGGSAAVVRVPADFETIQEAVDYAAEGDTVLVAPGTYSRTWERRLTRPSGTVRVLTNVLIEKPLEILSEAGAGSTVLHGSGLGPVIVIANARGVTVGGFTVKGGAADETVLDGGGGIYCELSDVEVRGCVIEENRAPFGAGIACFTASGLYVHDSTIRNNLDCEFGGGISLLGGSAGTIESNLFAGNAAAVFGGAMLIGEQSTAGVHSNTVVKNSATSGSGIFCRDGAEVDVSLNIFAFGEGGAAVYCDTLAQGRPCIMDLTCNDFWGNSSEDTRGCQTGSLNRNTDTFFCSAATNDFSICAFSPSLGVGDSCGRRGALPVGCTDCPAEERRLSWGVLKALYK
jgi:hypothetical protein